MFIAKQQSAGYFLWLPLGLKLQNTIINIISSYNDALGYRIKCSSLALKEIYEQSGRTTIFQEEVMQLINRHKTPMLLSPTCEEVFIKYLLENKLSYKQFPIYCFQVGTKYRDEIRPRNNILRACEFCMKDGYGFFVDAEQMNQFYSEVKNVYIKIFKHFQISVDIVKADASSMLGLNSEEFITENTTVETEYQANDKTKFGIEMAHIFNLGPRYSELSNKLFIDKNNAMTNVYMGSYGIGVDRVVYVLCQKILNKQSLPKELDLFFVIFIPRNKDCRMHDLYNTIPNAVLDDVYNMKYTDRILFAQNIGGKNIIIETENNFFIVQYTCNNPIKIPNNITTSQIVNMLAD